ncbi:mitochondrial substrate carrier family protein [Actinidia rufa]|uniref:Mitochondrial substrate carrier family protein n=1 Tax=Actinidia rufa TaxID=165716 RepID=A0A7J0DKF1_9ERIC|nr:mitochondrial substrate carrier family protein [Actinidia rufa]
MTRSSQPPRSNKPSIKYKCSPLEGASFELTDFDGKDYATASSGSCKQNGKKSEPKSSQILSTAELISAVGQIWDCANRPLAFLRPKTNLRHNDGDFPGENVLCESHGKRNDRSSTSAESQHLANNLMTKGRYLPMVHPNIECLKVSEKISFLEPLSGKSACSLRGSNLVAGIPNEYWKEKSPGTVGILYDLRNIYEWMNAISLLGRKHQVNSTLINNKKIDECCLFGENLKKLGNTANSANDLTFESTESHVEITKCTDSSLGQSSIAVENASTTSLCSDYYLETVQQQKKMHEHAFAGALAGIFVSLCLHPVDTVKTVIQSCRADQRSINYIVRSIITERGATGLYRGIASNIASSAPISAVYTFTYETVKGALLPFLPMGYQSFAHCIGGGGASIATSFIFTPSERIKQQMQVGAHYQNYWNALVGIIKKGGLPSLYAGWGAVLCRNIPHSIIKLICGGLAGSTATLFTTPFDVVKTRLQTQIPGSIHQYDGVFNTLVEIGQREGLKGLYRGLIPRLVMYVSQGAIFFASL